MADAHPGSQTLSELEIVDWRRRIAELYADVRRIAADDSRQAHLHWRETREFLYLTHPASPVPAEDRRAFRALHFDYDPALRFEVALEPTGKATDVSGLEAILPVSLPIEVPMHRLGGVAVPFSAGVRRLAVFWLDEYAGGLFLPFRDETNGGETYGAGRYLLDTAKGADLGAAAGGALVLDFNFAFQPSCAFDRRWACPLSPPENRLDFPVRAGERIA